MGRSVSVVALVAALSLGAFSLGVTSAQAANNHRPNRPGAGAGHRPGGGHHHGGGYRPGNGYRPGGGHHHGGHFHHGGRYRHGGGGGLVIAGMAGLFAGAAIANAYDPPPAPIPYGQVDGYVEPYRGSDWHSYCAAKYSTYDPRDGRYMAVDGRRYPCH
jgi:hypothetical protein